VRLTIDRASRLQDCEIFFEIIQEFHSSIEKNVLGKIKLNLAEYVDKVEDDEGVVRRYLMFDSKVNSTVKIGIAMHQTEGDRGFTTYAQCPGSLRFSFDLFYANLRQAKSEIGHCLWGYCGRCSFLRAIRLGRDRPDALDQHTNQRDCRHARPISKNPSGLVDVSIMRLACR
jgi:hypothetical protein